MYRDKIQESQEARISTQENRINHLFLLSPNFDIGIFSSRLA